jgi:hypothetical protein
MSAESAAAATSQPVRASTARAGVAAWLSGGPADVFFFDRGVVTDHLAAVLK